MSVLKYLDLEGLSKYNNLLKAYIDEKLDAYLPLSGGTMTGNINSINIIPKSNLTYNLGSSALSYNKLYARYIDTPSNYDLRFMTGGTEYMRIAASNGALVPNNTGTIDIGTSSYKFRNIYGNLKGNADTATTASSLPEAKLTWGGKNFAASWGPIDAAMIPELGANRLEYYPGSKIKIEYSTDNGTTWTDSGWEDKYKTQIFSTGRSVYLGGSEESGIDKSQYQTRITLTTASTVYSKLNKFAIKVSTTGSSNCWCTIDVRLQQNIENNVNTWKNIVENVTISGWSGWNIINTEEFTTYGNQKTLQYGEIRFTFGATHPSSSSYSGLIVSRIKGFGGEGWTTPSNKALTGTIYTEQYDQSTIWPANLLPSSNKTIDLGTDARYWRRIYGASIYGESIYENGALLINKYQAKGSYAITNNVPTTAIGISDANSTGIYYVNGTSDILGQQDGALIINKYSDSWISQIYQDYRTGKIALRGKNNGTWMPWLKLSYDGHDHNSSYKKIQTEVSDPVSSGSATSFIDTISQDTQGKITVTKKTISLITDEEISSLWN